MSHLSKKHFRAIADALRASVRKEPDGSIVSESLTTVTITAGIVADYFAQENPRFDRAGFLHYVKTGKDVR